MPRLKGADFNASVRRDSKGRFTKAGGALSAARSRDRASLADAVLGTAGAGPKRQRESPKFAAAGAALRAAKGGKSTSPAASGGRQAAVEQDVRAAYADAARAPGDWVPLAEIRDRIPGRNRGEVDSALESLAMQPGVQLIPWDNAKALKPRDHEAALHFGGEANHNLRIEDTTTSAAAPSRSLDEGLQQGIGSGNRAGFAFLAAEAERHDREEAARGSKPLQFKGAQLSDEERAAKLREGFERQAAAPKRTDTRGVLSANADTRSAAVQGARSEVAEQRQNEAKTDIRSAVLDLAGGPGEWVGLADLRDKLGTKHSRAEVDQALVGMLDEPDVRIIPVANQKALRKRDWDAAVEIGDTQNHAIMIAKPQMSYEEQERRASALTPYQSVSSHTHAEEVAAAGGDLASFRKAQARQAQAVADVRGETERRPASKAAAAGPSRTPGQQPKTVTAGSARPGDVVEYTRPGDRGARERVRATVTGTSGGRAITLDNGTTMHLSAEPKLISRADPRAQARTDRDEALRQRDDVLQRVADALPNVASREQAHAALSGLTVPELRRLAGVLGATFGAKATKSQLIARLVEIPGRRLDSDAIGRMGRQ